MLIGDSICNNSVVPDTQDAAAAAAEGWARVGQLIRDRRDDPQLGIRNQTELGDRVGVHKQTINYIENGKRPIRPSTARKIEAVLRWKAGAIDLIRDNPDATATTYADDLLSPNAAVVDMARALLETVEMLRTQLAGQPELNETITKMLDGIEPRLMELAKHDFSKDVLDVLNEIYVIRKDLSK
ncbi:Helix-turn-helix [Mycobacteroides abscessus subsp. abscessus]|uniref:helix-turn-helix domain-containing protein n=1 Tax=Mycobacteroides abscessus TaxID=36809 RepID=UPI000926C8D8|nr:helix-turn-helix transcriptional regulator [Mycobacteroides abscessus]SHU29368.1 Helix-turn-helix [Mycobacteroides abscessus subsp. abscessus]